jgi:hypothetical protein
MLTGALIAFVYRSGPNVIYLDHTGACDGLELDAEISAGGDWEEAFVVYEDGPPMPPEGNGMWEMRYPWREVQESDFEENEELSRDLCCLYTAQPTWRLIMGGL